jgi:hypothetical protein
MRLHKSQVIKASFFKYIRSDGKDGKAALMSCPEEVNHDVNEEICSLLQVLGREVSHSLNHNHEGTFFANPPVLTEAPC